MAIGYLQIQVSSETTAAPIVGATVRIVGPDSTEHNLITNSFGATDTVALTASEKKLFEASMPSCDPFSLYQVFVSMPGYTATNVANVKVFPQAKTILPVSLSSMGKADEFPMNTISENTRVGQCPTKIPEDDTDMGLPSSYPGCVLGLGDCSKYVSQIQACLNYICKNYPSIPSILNPNGQYDEATVNAVKMFQQAFDLPVTGRIDYATWYKISMVYTGGGEIYNGVHDGILSEQKEHSIKEPKKASDIAMDGMVDPPTWGMLDRKGPPMTECVRPPAPHNSHDKKVHTLVHTVQDGETLFIIAAKHGTSVREIKELNRLTNDDLLIGQILCIPSNGVPAPSYSPPPSPMPDCNGTTYTVKAGDSLWTIAQKYGVEVMAIKSASEISSDSIYIGQMLCIPAGQSPSPTPGCNGTTYTVKAGDSLWTIAQRYNTTVDSIKAKNGISSNYLSIGQMLCI